MIIFKYNISVIGNTALSLPEDAKVLFADAQEGLIYIWVSLDINKPKVIRYFKIIVTGQEFPEHYKYIDSVSIDEFVFHLFEK